MTSKSPVGDISVVTLIRTDTTLDHSQKAEKVCIDSWPAGAENNLCNATCMSIAREKEYVKCAPQLSEHVNQMIARPSIIGAIVV